MEGKLEFVLIPVSEVDRAKAFYAEKTGFDEEHDIRATDEMRVVQLTRPRTACSIAFGMGMVGALPGSI